MKKITIYLLLISSLVFLSCNGQNGKNPSLNLNDYNYEGSVLSEDEMIETSEKAIEIIKSKQLKNFEIYSLKKFQKIFQIISFIN